MWWRYVVLAWLGAWLAWCDMCLWRHALPGTGVKWGVLLIGVAFQVFLLTSLLRYWCSGDGYWRWALDLWHEQPKGRIKWFLLCAPAVLALASPFMVAGALHYGDADIFAKRQTDQAMVYRCALPCDVLGLNLPAPASNGR